MLDVHLVILVGSFILNILKECFLSELEDK
jgi:hypothetical protein